MRLLIIEDNLELLDMLIKGLENLDVQLDTARTRKESEKKVVCNTYDCILLDISLSKKDGADVLEYYRSFGMQTPILIITEAEQTEEKVFELNLGTGDYIRKPFQMVELIASIEAVTKKHKSRNKSIIGLGSLKINSSSRQVFINDQLVALSSKEFDILEYIAKQNPCVVSADEIMENVYNEKLNRLSSALRVHLSRLRKKLKDVGEKDILLTIRGKGYYLSLE